MKTLKSIFVFSLLFGSISLFAEGENPDNKKEVIHQLSQAQELDLLSEYIDFDTELFEAAIVQIYNSNFELVEEGEVSFDLETPVLDYLVGQSDLLVDLGHTAIYILK